MSQIQIRKFRSDEPNGIEAALDIVVRAMRDNPLHVRALGDDAGRRARRVEKVQWGLMASVLGRGFFLGAFKSGLQLGVLGVAQRKLSLTETARLLPRLYLGLPPDVVWRTTCWFVQWAKRQPRKPYWHLGPVAVHPASQGVGIGSAMMTAVCAQLDRQGALAYLETDKAVNVGFYRKFGFQTIDEASVLGVPNWFMTRRPPPR